VKPLKLDVFRKEIDQLDEELVAILVKRLEISKKIAVYKKSEGLKIRDRNRERELIKNRVKDIKDPKLRNEIADIFEAILSGSRSIQSDVINSIEHE